MRTLIIAAILAFGLNGCYTMIYPPPEARNYYGDSSDSSLVARDSAVSGGVVIYNQNQVIFDQYYQDPGYYRDYMWGNQCYWDPYYWNPYRYNRHNRWWGNRHYRGWYPYSPQEPAVKTPRRGRDYRAQEVETPPPTGAPAVNAPTPAQAVEPAKEEIKPETKPEEKKRELRSTEPAKEEPAKSPPPEESDKKQRREKTRDR